MAYYNGEKLLGMKDLDKKTPEIFIVTSNRSGGKTTWFGKLAVDRFLQKGEKFCLLYRYSYEMGNVSRKFFQDLRSLFFPFYDMTDKPFCKDKFRELFIRHDSDEEGDGDSCGYAVAINDANQVKNYSHFFSDVSCIIFDEFQSETGSYCPKEIEKFQSIHMSMARGHGKQSRYLPVYMIGNTVSLVNPYFIELGISTRLRSNTKFLRGKGFVLEAAFVESAAKAQSESRFNQAFASSSYQAFGTENVYLNDKTTFIESVAGKSRYLCTLRYNGADYAVRAFDERGILYCDNRPDASFPVKISVTTDDMKTNYVMLSANRLFISQLRDFFQKGCFRFKNLLCKEAVLKAFTS